MSLGELLFSLTLPAWGVAALLFALLWLRQLRTRDATSVDAAWAATIGLVAVWYALQAPGDPLRRGLVALLACFWSARLSFHLYWDRVRGEKEEDGRYRTLRQHWGDRAQVWFFVFYQGQAFVAVLFTVPFLAAMTRAGEAPALLDFVGLAIGAAAVTGEMIADLQLARFRRDPANRGRTCRAGLWRYSRHPNYFFEWTYWWAYVAIAAGGALWWVALFGPALMLLFLFRFTGIPYTEKQAIRSRGDDYRRYQRETSAFFPWPPEKENP